MSTRKTTTTTTTTAKRAPGRPATSAAKPIKKVAPPAVKPRATAHLPVTEDLIFPELPTDIAPATPFIPTGQYEPVIQGTFDDQNADVYDYVNQHTPLRTPAVFPFMDDTQELPELTPSQVEESNQIVHQLLRQSNQQQQQPEEDSESEQEEEEQPKPAPSRKRAQRQEKEQDQEEPSDKPKRARTAKPRVPFTQALPDEESQLEYIDFCASRPEFFDLMRTKLPGLSAAVYKEYPELARQMRSTRASRAASSSSSSGSFPLTSFFKYTTNEYWRNFSIAGDPLWEEQDPDKLPDHCPQGFAPFLGCDRLPVFEKRISGSLTASFCSLLSKHFFQLKFQSNEDGPIADRAKMLILNRNGTDARPITPVLNNITNFDDCLAHCTALAATPDAKLIARHLDALLEGLLSVIPTGFSQATLVLLNEQHHGFSELKKVLHPSPYTFVALPFPSPTASRSKQGPNHRLRFQCEYGDGRRFTFLRSPAESEKKEGNAYRSIELWKAYHVLPFFNGAVTSWGSELSTNFDTPILLVMVQ